MVEVICKCGCGELVEADRVSGDAIYKLGHRPKAESDEIRLCECGCNETFKCYKGSTQKFLNKKHRRAAKYEDRICPGCGIVFNILKCLDQAYHNITCFNKSQFKRGKNRERQLKFTKEGKWPWNKGLTKETSLRVLNGCSIPQSKSRKGVTREMKWGKEKAAQIKAKCIKSLCTSPKNLKRWAEGGNSSHGKFITGKYSSTKCNTEIRFSSSYELLALLKWEKDLTVILYKRYPSGIHYIKEGVKKYCFPDFIITYISSKQRVVEVKPKELLKDPENVFKFEIMRNYCQKNNLDFQIMTKEDTQEVSEEDLIAALPKIRFDNKAKEENFYKYYLPNLETQGKVCN